MTMLILAGLMAAAVATPAVTLAEARAMSAPVAGERLLAGQAHGAIVATREVPSGALPIPGVTQIELDEAAARLDRGCGFRRWTATFAQAPGAAAAVFDRAYPVWRVALANDRGCRKLSYAYVNPSTTPARALDLIGTIEALARRRPASVAVTCRTDVASELCDDDRTLLRRVVAKGAWLVKDDATVVYGTPGQVATSVVLSGDPVRSVAVAERIPAPF